MVPGQLMLVGIDASPHGGSYRGADRPRGETVCAIRAASRQPVYVRRRDKLIAVAAQTIPTLLVGHEQDDVGSCHSNSS